MKEKIERIIHENILRGVFPGCVVGVARKKGERIILPAGRFTFDENAPEMKEDSIFDVASITKVIPTSSLTLQLIDEGKLRLEDKLIDFIPEFQNSFSEKVLIKHLLTQTLHFSCRLSEHKGKTPEEILKIIFTSELQSEPGTNFFYANATSILLGRVIENILGESLDVLGEKYFFAPLNMYRTTFQPLKKFAKAEIVPTEIQDWRGGLVHGEVHDEGTYVLEKKQVVGAAGLFSTVPGILNFLEMLLNRGSFNGRKYFSEEIIKEIQTNQLSEIGEWVGLGWELNQPRYMGKYCSERTFGKTGFTGCVVVCDIEREVAFAILSNYTYPKRKQYPSLINHFRSDVADIVFENL